MLTPRNAAALLSSAQSMDALERIVTASGVARDAADLEPGSLETLGLEGIESARLAEGIGSLRALVVQLRDDIELRGWLGRTARRLSSTAPHVLWFVAALDARARHAALAAWHHGAHGPRIASLMWEPDRVVDSDAETICAIAAVRHDADAAVHGRLVEVLGRESLTRRFYRVLETHVGSLAEQLRGDPPERRAAALLYVSRLLFLAFLEAKGWLDGDRSFIATRFDECMRSGGDFHRRVLLPLFFGTLNTPTSRRAPTARAFGRIPFLNGGLFSRTVFERRAGRFRFSDDSMGSLLRHVFGRFRFVAREDSATWSDASIDPEMLGRAFESLMEAGERKSSGAFYTPHQLVAKVAEHALTHGLADVRELRHLRVLDPACGSGAFLVYALERLAELRRDRGEDAPVAELRRDILARSIFGVDRNPTAVWLCELRLWLSVVIDVDAPDPRRVPPLPNLDRNIRVGDALSGPGFESDTPFLAGGARLIDLRRRYVRASGTRKKSLAGALDREERKRVVVELQRRIITAQHARRELLASLRVRDLFGDRMPTSAESRRESKALRDGLRVLRRELARIVEGGALPFSFGAFFADACAARGFDIVLGNPPWVRLHRIPPVLRERFRRAYQVYRNAGWASGAAQAGAAPGFASQVDLAALFVERSFRLLRHNGVLSLLLPAKLWRSLAGGGVRRLLVECTALLRLEDLSDAKFDFDAAVYPSLLVARAGDPGDRPIAIVRGSRGTDREWQVAADALPFDLSPGAPWLMLPPEARAAFDRVRAAGLPLSSCFGPPRLGVKSGCNAAFVVRVLDTSERFASVIDADGEVGSVERSMLRPALRGDAIVPWTRGPCTDWVVWTHDASGASLPRLPDRTRAWLTRRYGQLANRSDARGKRWWSLFRVDAADSGGPRVVWSDISRRPRALVLPPGDTVVPLNSCYVLPCRDECDAWALAALLNSPLAAAWLNAVAEPARGGYHRYLGWTVGQLPVPRDWLHARAILSQARGRDDAALLSATLEAFRLSHAHVAELLKP